MRLLPRYDLNSPCANLDDMYVNKVISRIQEYRCGYGMRGMKNKPVKQPDPSGWHVSDYWKIVLINDYLRNQENWHFRTRTGPRLATLTTRDAYETGYLAHFRTQSGPHLATLTTQDAYETGCLAHFRTQTGPRRTISFR